MLSSTMKKLSIVAIFGLCGCGGGSSGGPGAFSFSDPEVKLDSVSNSKCLDIGKFTEALRSKHLLARKIIQDVNFAPINGGVSRNFSLRTAYGLMAVDDRFLDEMEEFGTSVQTGCESVVFSDSAGGETFSVLKASHDSITVSDSWDSRLTYKWISPTSMRVTHSYVWGDFNCQDKNKVRVTVEMLISWSGGVQTETINRNMINSDFLSLVSQASGYPVENIFVGDSEISVPKLREMAAAPPHEDLKLCH